MVLVAGFRGALVNPYRLDVATVAAQPLTGVKAKLAASELVRDSHTSVYRYHQTFGGKTRKTTLVAFELQPWSVGVVRAHEETSAMARELATHGIEHESAHTEALFCGYEDSERRIERLLAPMERQQPVLVVTTPDGTVHTLWRESDPYALARLTELFGPCDLHVLDGNGRYEGMLAYRDGLGELPERSTARFGLACLVNLEDPGLQLVARHRVVRGPKSRADVLTAAKDYFAFERIPGAAEDFTKQRTALGQLGNDCGFVALFPDDPDAWQLRLLPSVDIPVAQRNDAIVVDKIFLGRVAPGARVRSVVEPATVVKAVDDGAIGLIMRPLSLQELLRADESGELLPFGTTAFTPALARLVTYLIDPDEQLI